MKEAVGYIQDALRGIWPSEEIGSLVRIIMEEACHLPPHRLLLDNGPMPDPAQKHRIETIVARLQQREPIQYILGKAPFYGSDFAVDPSVLIPRPETEELVERIINRHKTDRPCVLDIGTGSGCIAITLAQQIEGALVTGVDVSEEALRMARFNAQRLGALVRFVRTDILLVQQAQADIPGGYDLIVSNPPYVMEHEKEDMLAHVLNFEPPLALFVPDADPLLYYRRIAALAEKKLNESGSLWFEINARCGGPLVELLDSAGFKHIALMQDLAGRDRFIQAQR